MAGPWEQYQQADPAAEMGPWSQYGAQSPAPVAPEPPFDWSKFLRSRGMISFDPKASAERGLSFERGLRDPVDAGARLLAQGLTAVAPAGSGFERWAQGQLKSVEEANREGEQAYRSSFPNNTPPAADTSRLGGDMLVKGLLSSIIPGAAAPSLVGRVAAGAGAGGLSGALTPVNPDTQDFWGDVAKQTGVGAATGAAVPLVTGGLARVVQPNTAPEVKMLMDAGVRPTPGQIIGGGANRLEEAATSIPLLGDFVKSGRARANEQFNRAAINRSLSPIGEELSASTPAGREAITEAGDKIGAAYDKLVPQLSAKVDPQFAQDVNKLIGMSQFMPAERAKQFTGIVQGKLADKLSPAGGMTGESFKEAESEIGRLATQYRNSIDADQRQLGGALQQLQVTMRDWLARSNPANAAELSNINSAYANLLRVQGAATRPGAEPGVFSPAQLQASVRQLDPTLRKRAFARGDAVMQDLAEAGKTVLGSKVPDSGTPFRSLATLLGGSALGGAMSMPYAGALAGGAAGAAGAYSPIGQGLIAHLLTSRPAGAAEAVKAIRGAAQPAAGVSYPLWQGIWGSLAP